MSAPGSPQWMEEQARMCGMPGHPTTQDAQAPPSPMGAGHFADPAAPMTGSSITEVNSVVADISGAMGQLDPQDGRMPTHVQQDVILAEAQPGTPFGSGQPAPTSAQMAAESGAGSAQAQAHAVMGQAEVHADIVGCLHIALAEDKQLPALYEATRITADSLRDQMKKLRDAGKGDEAMAFAAAKLGSVKLANACKALTTISDALGYEPDGYHEVRNSLRKSIRYLARKKLPGDPYLSLH